MCLNRLGYSIQTLKSVILVLCAAFLVPETSWGQISTQNDPSPQEREQKFIHNPDFPVRGTEDQRAKAQQEEGKEEALRSLQTQGELTVIPIPIVAYTRNADEYYGVILAILKPNAKGYLEDIFAPQYLHNKHIGEVFTINYYGYPSDTTQFNVVLTYATKVLREMDL